MDIPYTLIRSDRRSVRLEIARDGRLIVRAPRFTSHEQIRRIVETNRAWIEKHTENAVRQQEAHPEPSEEERKELIRQAKALLPEKVRCYAALMGVTPTGITVTSARTRFGSCSAKNRLSFSWRLMQYPEDAIDYVVVHELAHIRHHDHSPAFYAFIASVMPDHKERRALLRR